MIRKFKHESLLFMRAGFSPDGNFESVYIFPWAGLPNSDACIITDEDGYRYKRVIDPDLHDVWRFDQI